MNKIKNSFSKIKASDEFKDKLTKELLNGPKVIIPAKRNLYFRPSITAAALVMLIGIISFKLVANVSENGSTDLDNIAYIPKEDSQIDETYVNEVNGDTNSTTEDILPYNNSENEITPQMKSSTIENNISPKTEKTYTEDKIISQVETPSTGNNLNNKDNVIESVDSNSHNSTLTLPDKTESLNNDVSSDKRSFALNTLNNSVYVPKIQLPEANATAITTVKMMPLIVYKGNVYIYTPIQIPSENAKNLVGRKLGTTTGNINEWIKQSDYSNEFASNIGVNDVYAVNGYDEDFRIMTNITTADGKNYPEYYECLNGITIKNGEDIIKKLKLQDNIVQAKFQPFSDWNNGTGTFYTINDFDLIDTLLKEINIATPYLPEDIETSLGDYRNDDECKQLSFDLKDGSKNITLSILKSGYVSYGYPRIYLKIDNSFTAELWDKLGIMRIN